MRVMTLQFPFHSWLAWIVQQARMQKQVDHRQMLRIRRSTEISYAVRFGVVFKYLGQLCLLAAILACVPGAFAIVSSESHLSLGYFAAAGVLTAIGAATRPIEAPRRIQRNEAFVIATMIFPISATVMSLPGIMMGLAFEDAFFESMSGVTTTGLSTLPTVEDRPRTFLFARAWQQWYGGLGIVVLSLTLTTHPGVLSRRLGLTETADEDLLGSTRAHARRVSFIYAAISAVGFVALWALGLSWFDSLAHTLAAVSTGGFSTYDNSLAGFPSVWPQLATTAFCLVCAVSLPVYWRIKRDGWRVLVRELQLLALLLLGVAATLAQLSFMVRAGESWRAAAEDAVLMALSAQTTAGFSSTPVSELDASSKVMLIVSMAIGGCSESTAGGFKVLRLIIMFRLLQTILIRSALPKHAVHEPQLVGQRLEDSDIEAALLIVLLFVAVVMLSWLPFVAYGYDPLDSLFEVVSATGTVGLSTGVCGAELPSVLKAVLCLDMLLGRLEFIALLVVVSPRTWIGKRVAEL